MVRTWTLMIALALLWASVCAGQEGYVDMAPIGIDMAPMAPLSYNSLFAVGPQAGGNGLSLEETLGGVQANLTVFEQSSAETGLPMNLMPYWGNLPDMAAIQASMGVQQPEDMRAFLNIAEASPSSAGQLSNLGLPTSTLMIGSTSALQMPDFAGGQWQIVNQ